MAAARKGMRYEVQPASEVKPKLFLELTAAGVAAPRAGELKDHKEAAKQPLVPTVIQQPLVVGIKDFSLDNLTYDDQCYCFQVSLGSGGFGAVHQGTYCSFEENVGYKYTEVAIKRSHAGKEAKLQLEADIYQIIGKSHYIVSFVGFKNDQLVTELMDNGSLLTYANKHSKSLDWPIITKILFEVASGLSALHKKGYVHADLHAGNVLLDSKLHAKITDFGLAIPIKVALGKSKTEWIAPELKRSGVTLYSSYESDIYSFGYLMVDIAGSREVPKALNDLMSACRATEPEKRPTLRKVLLSLVYLLNQPERLNQPLPNISGYHGMPMKYLSRASNLGVFTVDEAKAATAIAIKSQKNKPK